MKQLTKCNKLLVTSSHLDYILKSALQLFRPLKPGPAILYLITNIIATAITKFYF